MSFDDKQLYCTRLLLANLGRNRVKELTREWIFDFKTSIYSDVNIGWIMNVGTVANGISHGVKYSINLIPHPYQWRSITDSMSKICCISFHLEFGNQSKERKWTMEIIIMSNLLTLSIKQNFKDSSRHLNLTVSPYILGRLDGHTYCFSNIGAT